MAGKAGREALTCSLKDEYKFIISKVGKTFEGEKKKHMKREKIIKEYVAVVLENCETFTTS